MITGKQSKAARAILGWSLDELAERSGVARTAIANLEKNITNSRQSSLEALYNTFSAANIEFFGKTGVKEKEDEVELLTGHNFLQKLWDNILFTLGNDGGEVLITNVDEKRTTEQIQDGLDKYLDNKKKNKITERLLSCEGDTFFLMPGDCYRWIPREVFTQSTATFVYENKIAYLLWSSQVVILVHCKKASEAERERFEYMWENALIPSSQNTLSEKTI